MARHGNPGARPTAGTPTLAAVHRISPATSGRILVAAVAVGAVVPAIQTMGTHVADAESGTTTELGAADLALASQAARAGTPAVHPTAVPASSAASAVPSGPHRDVSTVAMPVSSSRTAEAGDATDLSSLTRAMSVGRENGPLEFGTPYTAGNDKSLNGQIAKALGLMGLPQKLAPGVKKIIMRESTGNADAVNDWDSNAAAGTPSKGLMQLIDTTFRNAVLPSQASKGIFDPVANITAGVRTMIANHSIDDVMAGGLKNSAGNYIGYGGAALPDDGLGLASKG